MRESLAGQAPRHTFRRQGYRPSVEGDRASVSDHVEGLLKGSLDTRDIENILWAFIGLRIGNRFGDFDD